MVGPFANGQATGTIEYNSTGNIFEYYDGSQWVSLARGNTGTNCSLAGAIRFDADKARYEFCNGTNWLNMKGFDTSVACTKDGELNFNTTNSDYEFCSVSTNTWWSTADYCEDKSAWATYNASGTAGTPADPFLICNATQLADIAGAPAMSSSYKLMSNIDMAPYYAAPNAEFQIGACGAGGCANWDGNDEFTGTFDGAGYSIDNFSLVNTGIYGAAFFGATTNRAVIKNLYLTNINISGGSITGGLIGGANQVIVENCHVSGTVSGVNNVGGLLGSTFQARVSRSTYAGNVSGTDNVGGIVGSGYHVYVGESKFLSGTVAGADDNTGGIVGDLDESVVYLSSSAGTINGVRITGGIAGRVDHSSVANSFSSANITGTVVAVGGIAGVAGWPSYIVNSYATGSVSGAQEVGGAVGSLTTYGRLVNTYSTASVNGTAGSGSVGFLVGRDNGGTAINSYYLSAASCDSTGSGGACGTIGTAHPLLSDFYNQANAPMSSWDSVSQSSDGQNDVWVFSGSNHATHYYEYEESYTIPFSGSGTTADPYLITSVADFNRVGQNPRWMSKSFKITQNLDFTAASFIKMGGEMVPLFGNLDGNNKTLSNITYSAPNEMFVGVVGRASFGENGVFDLNFTNLSMSGANYVGGVVGFADSTSVGNIQVFSGTVAGTGLFTGGVIGRTSKQSSSDLKSLATVNGGTESTGGIIGYAYAGGTYRAVSGGNVNGTASVGGVVGGMVANTIYDSYFTGNVVGTGDVVGGIVGSNHYAGVEDSFSTGTVQGASSVGGAIGFNGNGGVTNVFATGTVDGTGGTTVVGRLIGDYQSGTISDSYSWASSACDSTGAGGACHAVGATQPNVSDFYDVNKLPLSNWDFSWTWVDQLITYPKLLWEP